MYYLLANKLTISTHRFEHLDFTFDVNLVRLKLNVFCHHYVTKNIIPSLITLLWHDKFRQLLKLLF